MAYSCLFAVCFIQFQPVQEPDATKVCQVKLSLVIMEMLTKQRFTSYLINMNINIICILFRFKLNSNGLYQIKQFECRALLLLQIYTHCLPGMTARYLPKPTDKSDVSLLIYELFTLLFNNDSNCEDKKQHYLKSQNLMPIKV